MKQIRKVETLWHLSAPVVFRSYNSLIECVCVWSCFPVPFPGVKQEQLSPRSQAGQPESLVMQTSQESSVLRGKAVACVLLYKPAHVPRWLLEVLLGVSSLFEGRQLLQKGPFFQWWHLYLFICVYTLPSRC